MNWNHLYTDPLFYVLVVWVVTLGTAIMVLTFANYHRR